MIRSSLESDAAHGAVLMMSAGGETALHSRYKAGAWTTTSRDKTTTSTRNTRSAMPQWLALERIGGKVVGSCIGDGEVWTAIGSAAIGLGETVYVGIAATSSDIYQPATADVSHVSVSGLPPWQRQANIGAPVLRGSAWHSNGTYTVTGGGAIGDTHDQFNFVFQTMRGDFDIAARVAYLSHSNPKRESGRDHSRIAHRGLSPRIRRHFRRKRIWIRLTGAGWRIQRTH